MIKRILSISLMATMVLMSVAGLSMAAEPVTFGVVAEITGAGASTGQNWERGVHMALEEINAAGGILGRKVETFLLDTKTEPTLSVAVMKKAIEMNPFLVMGTCYSSSTIVNMHILQEAGIPQFTAAEAPAITKKGNPCIFRTSYNAELSMQKAVKWIMEVLKTRKMALIYANTEFGRGGRDALLNLLKPKGVEIVADVGTDLGQSDFTGELARVKASGADTLFIYMHEDESGRILPQIKQMGLDKAMKVAGHVTLIGPEVLKLAREAAEGIPGHVDLTPEAPTFKPVADRYVKKYGKLPDHNFFKAYIAIYVIKATIEEAGVFDRKKFLDTIHNKTFCVKDHPGILLDIHYDENGDIDRESFLAKVQGGKQVITGNLPPLHPEWFEKCKK